MYLESKENLTVNSGVSGTKDVKVCGYLDRSQTNISSGDMLFIFAYIQKDSSPQIVLDTNEFIVKKEEIDALYESLKNDLPDINVVGYSNWNKKLVFEAFRTLMATTFSISTKEILIIED